MLVLVSLLLGMAFGVVLTRSGVLSWFRIQECRVDQSLLARILAARFATLGGRTA
jgi:hypothetical protein